MTNAEEIAADYALVYLENAVDDLREAIKNPEVRAYLAQYWRRLRDANNFLTFARLEIGKPTEVEAA